METTPVGDDPLSSFPGGDPESIPPGPSFARGLRIVELWLVLLVAFGVPIYTSLTLFLPTLLAPGPGSPPRDYTRYPPVTVVEMFGNDLRHLAALAVCAYVLFRQGRSFRKLGLTWTHTDLFLGGAFTLANYLAYHAMYSALHEAGAATAISKGLAHYMYGAGTGGTLVRRLAVSAYFTAHTAITGLFEELIARAYLMKEVTLLSGSVQLAVLVSVVLQASYHLYQGWPAALCAAVSFLVLSLYYAGTWRATPIILAHMLFDLVTALRQTWS